MEYQTSNYSYNSGKDGGHKGFKNKNLFIKMHIHINKQ